MSEQHTETIREKAFFVLLAIGALIVIFIPITLAGLFVVLPLLAAVGDVINAIASNSWSEAGYNLLWVPIHVLIAIVYVKLYYWVSGKIFPAPNPVSYTHLTLPTIYSV